MAALQGIICVLAGLVVACASRNYSAQCESPQEVQFIRMIQGEGLRLLCPNHDCSKVINDSLIFWFKKGSDGIQPISTETQERVYYQDSVLYFLPLSLNDTGFYVTLWWYDPPRCDEFQTELVVDETFHPQQLYANVSENVDILPLDCPVWLDYGETISWYKDFRRIPNRSDAQLKVFLPLEESKGIYTCVCTWERHGRHFNTTGSFRVLGKEYSVAFPPTFQQPTNNSVTTVDLEAEARLNCLVFFGINTRSWRSVCWMRNNKTLDCDNRMVNGSIESTLTISQVSDSDLQSEFCCVAISLHQWKYVCITLRAKASLLPAAVALLCAALLLPLAAWTLHRFTVDLVLFLRRFRAARCRRDDGKAYDAYVIYQEEDGGDETSGGEAARFVHGVLPDVLEDACGFRLYVPGRDDLPGEDCTRLVETRMALSRRLIAVLPPGVRQGGEVATPQRYDWDVGLHRALVEQELRVIPIQLGDMNDYSHLPLGLQHILHKTPPLRWDERRGRATSPASRFWKKVRYMMPVPSASASRDGGVQI